ncbi:MAG: hypothetical protein HY280_01045, partial [Nitrospinae bacterium]|nr:hypothetical protein [Nitrospinota bacterium]
MHLTYLLAAIAVTAFVSAYFGLSMVVLTTAIGAYLGVYNYVDGWSQGLLYAWVAYGFLA